MSKLYTLMNIEGYDDVIEFLFDVNNDSICPGICINPDCEYTCEVEPDCANGYCEECGTPSVKSALALARII